MTPEEEVASTLARLGIAATDMIVSKTIARRTLPAARAEFPLPRLSFDSDLVATSEIGRGGMGIVRLAEQRSLDREVAIKTSTSTDARIVQSLVREARVMGALAHPNIVPVHALGVDEAGLPLLVMKRIEGATWRELLDDAKHPAWSTLLAGHDDKLRAHIAILSQVSLALAFAHDKGIIHRDLKPENVMIGRFGEIYLLDWGVALRVSERDTESPALVGTPGYLAPEMAHGDPKLVDERTDVYLLGATLYEVMTGRMPHEGGNAIAALVAALAGNPPPMPSDANPELIAIVRASMAREKEERIPSAEAFREALARFVVARDADIVAAAARASLGSAENLSKTEGAASANAFRALIEARFGFVSAQKMRPHDESLRAELDATIGKLVEREIALRSPDAAKALLGELAMPAPDLTKRVVALRDEVSREREAAEAHSKARRDADISRMVRPFTAVLVVWLILAIAFGSINAIEAAHGENGFPMWQGLTLDLFLLFVLIVVVFSMRRSLLTTVASRRVMATYAISTLGVVGSDVVSFALRRPTGEAAAHALFLSTVVTAVLAISVLPRLWSAVPVGCIAVGLVIAVPRYAPMFALMDMLIVIVVYVRAFRHQGGRLNMGDAPHTGS